MKKNCLLYILLHVVLFCHSQQVNKLLLNTGSIHFLSDAPLEQIEANSTKLKGLLLMHDRSFAFTVDINTFNGFNGSIQREHFNENYMETDKFPKASFVGKIVEDVDFKKDGKYELRAKGKLNIHGIEKERIIKVLFEVKNGRINVAASFIVKLDDHGISIPNIVNQKIAEEIKVEVFAQFNKYE